MHTDQLRAFLVLADELNYRRAAQRLKVSQPALTAQIRGLERALGTRLFDRDRAGTHLSDAGRTVLPLALTASFAVGDMFDAAVRAQALPSTPGPGPEADLAS